MQVLHGLELRGKHDRDSGRTFSGLELRDSRFEGCSFGVTRDVRLRTTLRDSRVIQCHQRGCSVGPAIFEDVLIEGLGTDGQLLQAWGAAFKHVILRGAIDRLMLSPAVVLTDPGSAVNESFRVDNASYYGEVDWALDISQVEAKELEIQGVPARLIRRDPETQVMVTAKKAVELSFDKLNFGRSHWGFSIQFMLERGEHDIVLVAPKRSPKFKTLLDGLRMLREAGIAEAD